MDEEDVFNDETFGSACAIDSGLPSFFQQTKGRTLIDELGCLEENLEGLEDSLEGDTFTSAQGALQDYDPTEKSMINDDEFFAGIAQPPKHESLQPENEFGNWRPTFLEDALSRLNPPPFLPPGARVLDPSELPVVPFAEMERLILGEASGSSFSRAMNFDIGINMNPHVTNEQKLQNILDSQSPLGDSIKSSNTISPVLAPIGLNSGHKANPQIQSIPLPLPFPLPPNARVYTNPPPPVAAYEPNPNVIQASPSGTISDSPSIVPPQAVSLPNHQRPHFSTTTHQPTPNNQFSNFVYNKDQSPEQKYPSSHQPDASSGRGGDAGRGGRGRGFTGRGAPGSGYNPTGPPLPRVYLPNLPRGTMMSTSDVRFVVERVLQPMLAIDPYNEEYYLLQLKWRKFQESKNQIIKDYEAQCQLVHASAATGNPLPLPRPPPLPPVPALPLPAWPDVKERIRKSKQDAKERSKELTKAWEEAEHVLGHVVKADISRPRQLLALASSVDTEADGEIEGTAGKIPFTSKSWLVREAIQKAYTIFYQIQELQLLLRTPIVAHSTEARNEMFAALSNAIHELAQALGIVSLSSPVKEDKQEPNDASLAPAPNPGSHSPHIGATVDGNVVGYLLQASKGKRLITRGLWFLSVELRWLLLPVILTKLFQCEMPTSADDVSVESKLVTSLQQFLEGQIEYQQTLKRQEIPMGDLEKITCEILNNIRHCVKSIVVSNLEKSALKKIVGTKCSRLDLLFVITKLGDSLILDASKPAKIEWEQTRESLLSVLDH